MSHLSLYRKYRPQTFGEIVGQQHVTQTLRRAVAEGRVSHALLFSGPRGTGKTSTARILAKALNCEKRGDEPCNECTSCRQVTEGNSMDVVEIDAASHGSVDDARDLREKVAYAPVSGRWKVYIIDECHMLSPAANNALLKVLEEPPGHVIFVFATTEPQKVLQTLIDRCQSYQFRAVGAADIAERISFVCEAEGIWIDDEALRLVASRAGGSVRDGLSLLEQLRSYSGDKVTAEAVAELLGALPEDLMFEAGDLISERDAGAMFGFVNRLVKEGIDMLLFGHSLVGHLRSLFLVMHAPAAREILELSDERIERLRAQANHFDHAEVLRLLDLCNEAQLQMRQGLEPRLCLEVALARMTRPDLHPSPASLLERIERLEEQLGMGRPSFPGQSAAPPPAMAPAPAVLAVLQDEPVDTSPRPDMVESEPAAPGPGPEVPPGLSDGPVDLEKVRLAWPVILDKVKRSKISFQALLIAATPVAYREGELILEFGPRSRFHRDRVSDQAAQAPLLESFEAVLGMRPRIRCVLAEEAPPPARPKPAPAPEHNDPTDYGPPSGDQSPPVTAIDLIKEAFVDAEVVDEP